MAAPTATELKQRISAARADRQTHAPRANDFYDTCAPYRQNVSTTHTEYVGGSASKQGDIFDQTAQIEVVNFAADMVDYFTPHHKNWATAQEFNTESEAQSLDADEQSSEYLNTLFAKIRSSNFYAASEQTWIDTAGGAAGMLIRSVGPTSEISCTPIPMAQLLLEYGPDGTVDGRWFESYMLGRHLRSVFSFKIPEKFLTKEALKKKHLIEQGAVRDLDRTDDEVWHWHVFIDGKLVHKKELTGVGSCPIVVKRWSTLPNSAWGPGCGDQVVAAARTLDELGYIGLKRMGKMADPPLTYDQDGVFNPEGGIEAGEYIPRRAGTRSNFDWLMPPGDTQEIYFDRDELRQVVKTALYQDKPYQRGDTPPSASQWMDERAKNDRRLSIIRANLYNDWTLGVMRRFAHLLQQHGVLPIGIVVGSASFPVKFDSALSKAADIEEVQLAQQLLQILTGLLGENALASIDAKATGENIKAKLGDELVVLVNPSDQDDLIQKALGEGRNLIREAGPAQL